MITPTKECTFQAEIMPKGNFHKINQLQLPKSIDVKKIDIRAALHTDIEVTNKMGEIAGPFSV